MIILNFMPYPINPIVILIITIFRILGLVCVGLSGFFFVGWFMKDNWEYSDKLRLSLIFGLSSLFIIPFFWS